MIVKSIRSSCMCKDILSFLVSFLVVTSCIHVALVRNCSAIPLSKTEKHVLEQIFGKNSATNNTSHLESQAHHQEVIQTTSNSLNAAGDENNKAVSTVVLSQVLFRHGDRGPKYSYPTDPHKNDWPEGFYQLTKVGKVQAYHLGSYLKYRYQDFLSKDFNHEEVYVRSTNTDRTLMTAECVLAGLLPFNVSGAQDGDPPWPFGHWQPVPIQTLPSETDRLLLPTHACEYVSSLHSGLKAYYVTNRKMINDKDLMMKLSRFTGMSINVTSLPELADIVFCQKAHNMSQPDWMTPELEDDLLDCRGHTPALTPEDGKYLSGTLLDTIITNMLQKAKDPSDPHKLYLYSAHDVTVMSLMALLGVHNNLQVPYTAAFIIELHLINGKHFVKLLYRNDTSQPPYDLKAPRCGVAPCPLNVFHGSHEDYIFSDEEWDDVCVNSSTLGFTLENSLLPALISALVIAVVINIFLGIKVCSYRRRQKRVPGQEQYALLRNQTDGSDSEIEMEELHTHENNNLNHQNGIVTADIISEDEEEWRKDEI